MAGGCRTASPPITISITGGERESAHLLAGRLRDAGGEAMVPSHTRKGSVRYRYYVARAAGLDGKRLRLPAHRSRQWSWRTSGAALYRARRYSMMRPLIIAELEAVTVARRSPRGAAHRRFASRSPSPSRISRSSAAGRSSYHRVTKAIGCG